MPAPLPAALLLTAAGSSTRFGGGKKKEYIELDGKSVLAKALDSFLDTGLFQWVLITHPVDREEEILDALGPDRVKGAPLLLTPGGETRQESVRKGLERLEELSPALVLIHDAARPWIDSETIRSVFAAAAAHGAAAPVIPAVDAMKRIDGSGLIIDHLPRTETVGVQTPQGFRFPDILAAHRRAADDGRTYIDDTEIYHRFIGKVRTVPGNMANRKITYREDIES